MRFCCMWEKALDARLVWLLAQMTSGTAAPQKLRSRGTFTSQLLKALPRR